MLRLSAPPQISALSFIPAPALSLEPSHQLNIQIGGRDCGSCSPVIFLQSKSLHLPDIQKVKEDQNLLGIWDSGSSNTLNSSPQQVFQIPSHHCDLRRQNSFGPKHNQLGLSRFHR